MLHRQRIGLRSGQVFRNELRGRRRQGQLAEAPLIEISHALAADNISSSASLLICRRACFDSLSGSITIQSHTWVSNRIFIYRTLEVLPQAEDR